MEKTKRGFISNFFIEMVIVILFFSISSIILVKIYATTVYNNDINKIRSNVIINASSIIDVYKSGYDAKGAVKKTIGSNCSFIRIDKNWCIKLNKVLEPNKKGEVKLLITENNKITSIGKVKTLTLKYIYNNMELYVIEGKKYVEEK